MPKPVPALLLALLVPFMGSPVKADIAIITHKASPVEQLNMKQAKDLWLGKIHKLPNIGRISVVDQSGNSTIREEFYKTPIQLKTYWAKIIFTGKTLPPKVLSSDKKVIDFISKEKNRLGYIDSRSVSDKIKVLLTIKSMEIIE